MQSLDRDTVARWRQHCLEGTVVSTREECLAFVRRVRLCYPFTAGPGGIPALFAVLRTHSENQRWDWSWTWKDQLHQEGSLFYGRIFGGKPLLLDPDLLPPAFSASGRTGDDAEDASVARAEGTLSPLAQRVLLRLADGGATPARVLRRELLGPGSAKSGLDRVLTELQAGCFIALQIEPEAAWGYSHRWDLFTRLFPDAVAAAASLPARAGAATVLRHYLAVAGAATVEEMRTLFPWPEPLLLAALGRLVAEGDVVPTGLSTGSGYASAKLVTTG